MSKPKKKKTAKRRKPSPGTPVGHVKFAGKEFHCVGRSGKKGVRVTCSTKPAGGIPGTEPGWHIHEGMEGAKRRRRHRRR